MTVIPVFRPYVFLRCWRCDGKTDHVLIKTRHVQGKEVVEEIYECQEYGEAKIIYELVNVTHFPTEPCEINLPIDETSSN